MEDSITFEPAVRSVICEQSRAAYPREACGLLIGSRLHALQAVPCRNMATEADRFQLHPEDFLRAELDAQAADLAVIGVWHSHPGEPAVPSQRDLKDANPAWTHVICRVDDTGVTSLRAWRLGPSETRELPIGGQPLDDGNARKTLGRNS
jgi:proteasome lid subunit RPN8/RPN11